MAARRLDKIRRTGVDAIYRTPLERLTTLGPSAGKKATSSVVTSARFKASTTGRDGLARTSCSTGCLRAIGSRVGAAIA
jgi:hypothetical protein